MSAWRHQLRRACSAPFVTVCILLLLAVAGLHGATAVMGWALRQAAVPMRRDFRAVPARIGPYELVRDDPLPAAVRTALRTERTLARVYRDTRRDADAPGAAVWLHLLYYTGTDETMWVRHMPEVCYAAGGYQQLDVRARELVLDLPDAAPAASGRVRAVAGERRVELPGTHVPVREFLFDTPASDAPMTSVYFFVANGRYAASKRALRLHMLDLRARTAYYCKVEVVPGRLEPGAAAETVAFRADAGTPEAALGVATEFLSAALPHIMLCLPAVGDAQMLSSPAAGDPGP